MSGLRADVELSKPLASHHRVLLPHAALEARHFSQQSCSVCAAIEFLAAFVHASTASAVPPAARGGSKRKADCQGRGGQVVKVFVFYHIVWWFMVPCEPVARLLGGQSGARLWCRAGRGAVLPAARAGQAAVAFSITCASRMRMRAASTGATCSLSFPAATSSALSAAAPSSWSLSARTRRTGGWMPR